jgi:hypothetical protein
LCATQAARLYVKAIAGELSHQGVPTSDVPTKAAQENARQVCSRADVTNAILLKDCILDVAVTGNEALADAYVYSPTPKRDITVTVH